MIVERSREPATLAFLIAFCVLGALGLAAFVLYEQAIALSI